MARGGPGSFLVRVVEGQTVLLAPHSQLAGSLGWEAAVPPWAPGRVPLLGGATAERCHCREGSLVPLLASTCRQ